MDALVRQLTPMKLSGKIDIWEKGLMMPGENRNEVHREKLNDADIVVVLVSSDYFGTESLCVEELNKADELEKVGSCLIIPVLLRDCDYSHFEEIIIPRNNGGKTLAVTSWQNQDEALHYVVLEIDRVVRRYSGKQEPQNGNNDADSTPGPPAHEAAEVTKNTARENVMTAGGNIKIGDENKGVTKNEGTVNIYNFPEPRIPNPPEPLTLENIWNEFPLKKGIPPLKLLELNRMQEFRDELMEDFSNKANEDQNLYYFINCCNSHCPENMAKRFVHFCDDIFIEYARVADGFDDVFVFDVNILRTPVLTWKRFWDEFLDKLPSPWRTAIKIQSPTHELEFDTFIASAHEHLQDEQRYPVLCKVKAMGWNNGHVDEHLSYFIEQFSRLPKGANKFVFLFLMELNDLHTCICEELHPVTIQHKKIVFLRHKNFQSEIIPHIVVIKLLNHISKTDIKNWLDALLDNERMRKTLEAYYEMLLKALQVEMSEYELQLYEESQRFQMNRLFIMQRHAYQYVK